MPRAYELGRFYKTQAIIKDGVETYGSWSPPNFLNGTLTDDQIGYFPVTSALAGRPDLISNRIYGTPELAWVLIAFNNAREALNWPVTGDRIAYPIEAVVLPEVVN